MDRFLKQIYSMRVLGYVERLRLKYYQFRFGYDDWHCTPIQQKPYIIPIIDFIESHVAPEGLIVEVGCGRGDIIGNIQYTGKKIGIDLSDEVGQYITHFYKDVYFLQGSFGDVNFGEIECLVMVNFIHTMSSEKLKSEIGRIIRNNDVHMFVFDVLENIEASGYKYSHNGEYLLEGGLYKKFHESPVYIAANGAKRHIEYWLKLAEVNKYAY